MSWGKPPDAAGMDAERTVRLFRVACATALRHLDGVAKFGDALVALETAERRLAEFSVAEVRALASGASPDARRVAAALVSLRDATDRASKKLDNWLAASKTKRMMGYDGNVRAALNELAVRAVDVADAAREHADDARESPDKLPDKLPNPLEVLAGTAFDDREAELEPKPNLPPAARPSRMVRRGSPTVRHSPPPRRRRFRSRWRDCPSRRTRPFRSRTRRRTRNTLPRFAPSRRETRSSASSSCARRRTRATRRLRPRLRPRSPKVAGASET